jgi:formylglycine-generating enzyme required for sulfatase activity
MGSPETEAHRRDNEQQHEVTLTTGFWLGETEVTQQQWQALMAENPSEFKGDKLPVETVSWDDCAKFLANLRALEPAAMPANYDFSLPTEAQWEYACRAGTTTAYAGEREAMAWSSENSGRTTHAVGTKQANNWGLFDMAGNVWEWCQDWYGAYSPAPVLDPRGAAPSRGRVLRGASWSYNAPHCRSAYRRYGTPSDTNSNFGLRLALIRRSE